MKNIINNLKRFSRLIGLLLLAIVLTILFATPGTIFSRSIWFIYPDLANPGNHATGVQTKMDFGDQEHVDSFPMEFGEWKGKDYDPEEEERMRDQLGASVLMMRDYRKPGLWRGLTLLIMQSEDHASFHPPEVCYPALGWEVQEKGFEAIPLPQSFWKEISNIGPLDPHDTAEQLLGPVIMSKLVVTNSENKVYDRHIVLYCYVRNNSFWGNSNNTVTMIRVSGPTLPVGTYSDMLDTEKEFLAEVMPLLFEAQEKEDTVISQIVSLGHGGVLLLILIFGAPFTMVFQPEIGRLYSHLKQRS